MARAHVDLQLRWADQDVYGHINNVAIARYLEEARVRLFWEGTAREQTGLEQFFKGDRPGGPKMLVASQHIEYLKVLEYGDAPLTAEIWFGKFGGSSFEVHYELVDGSIDERTVVARAITTVVMVDGETWRPIKIDPEGRAAAQAWTDEPLKLGR